MKVIGITGIDGFIGSHLRDYFERQFDVEVKSCNRTVWDDKSLLELFVTDCDVIYHIAGMNRSDIENEIYETNIMLATKLASACEATYSTPNIVFTSSTQIDRDNEYGKSKIDAGNILYEWADEFGGGLINLILPNVFGDNGKPFYNSVVATFCHQISRNETPSINGDAEIDLIYINELVEIMATCVKFESRDIDHHRIPSTVKTSVSELFELLNRYNELYYTKRIVPDHKNDFELQLYNTFVTYMNSCDHAQYPIVHSDDRGSLFEVVKLEGGSQVFYSTTKPGITRGNHYHTRKNEKFCVVHGNASIKIRRIGTDEIKEFIVSGDKPTSIEMPIFHTHNITNIGDTDLLTIFWTNELFNPDDPDTFFMEV